MELRRTHAEARELREREIGSRRENRKLKATLEQVSVLEQEKRAKEFTELKTSVTAQFAAEFERYRAQTETENKDMAERFAKEFAKAKASHVGCCLLLHLNCYLQADKDAEIAQLIRKLDRNLEHTGRPKPPSAATDSLPQASTSARSNNRRSPQPGTSSSSAATDSSSQPSASTSARSNNRRSPQPGTSSSQPTNATNAEQLGHASTSVRKSIKMARRRHGGVTGATILELDEVSAQAHLLVAMNI
jgi:hypothetical protein